MSDETSSVEGKIDWKTLRTDLGLTQKSVAIATGIGQTYISDYEQGKRIPTIEREKKLLDFYLNDENLALKKKRASNINSKSNVHHLPVGSIDPNQARELVADDDYAVAKVNSVVDRGSLLPEQYVEFIDLFNNGDLLIKNGYGEFFRATKL